MPALTRRRLIQGLGASTLIGAAGCSSITNVANVKLVNTNATSFTGGLEIAGGRLWLKQSPDLPNPEAFVYDTGAVLTTVYRNAEKYGATSDGEVDVRGIGDTSSLARAVVNLKPIALGANYKLPSHRAIVSEREDRLLSSVLLGATAFDKQVLDLDFQANTYRVSTEDTKNEDYPGAKKEWIAGSIGGMIVNDIKVDGVGTAALLDTGFPGSILLFPKFLKKYDIMKRATKLGPYSAVVGFSGKLSFLQFIKVSEIQILGMTFRDIWVTAILDKDTPSPGRFGIDALVGLDLIKHFKLTVDLIKRKRMLATPTQDTPVQGEPLYRSSKWVATTFQGELVMAERLNLDPNSTDYRTMEEYVQAGNPRRILSINGFALNGDFDPLALAQSRKSIAPQTFEVEDGSGTKTIVVEPEKLV